MGAKVTKKKKDEKTAEATGVAGPATKAASESKEQKATQEKAAQEKADQEKAAQEKAAKEKAAKEAEEKKKEHRALLHSISKHISVEITEAIDHALEDVKLVDGPSRANLHTRGLKHADVWEFYTRGRVVGKGMCGDVYAAKHKISGQRCAVKSVRKCNVKPKMYKDLLKEISMLQTLDHPNVVKLVEAFDDDKNIYLVTEFCAGGELYTHLIDEGYYDEDRAREVFSMMVNAIRYCHRAGVCSRDLKLENFVFQTKRSDSPLKLLDFGLACHFGTGLSRMQSMVGTPYYVAPEILNVSPGDAKSHYSQKCDIWSLGVILYMLLAGTPPFSAKSTHGILAKIRNSKVEFPPDLWDDVSPEAKDLCARLLIKDVKLRIPIEQVVLHPWLKRAASTAAKSPVKNEVAKQLKKFVDYCHMQKTAIEVISVLLSDKQIAHLRDEFQKIDTNGTGTLSLDEFASALANEVTDKEQLERIFHHVDRNGSGEISYSEFIAASVHHSVFSNEKHLRASYERFADAETGGIPIAKLEHLLSENLAASEVEHVLSAIDKNDDGVVSWPEYLSVMNATAEEKMSETELEAEREILQLHHALSIGPAEDEKEDVMNMSTRTVTIE